MSGEFAPAWADMNTPENAINAANLHRMMSDLNCVGNQFVYPDPNDRGRLIINECDIKLVVNGVHKIKRLRSPLTFDPILKTDDSNTMLLPGKNYYLYAVDDGLNGDLVCSQNATFPIGATAETSRKIAGFHTMCADVIGAATSNPYRGFLAGEIMFNTVWDLLNRPTCSPEGMAKLSKLPLWIDIYLQSGSLANTKSAFGGTVTKSQSFDLHQEDLAAVGKQMLEDAMFTVAALGTIPYKAVMGAADPITTGGKKNTDGNSIISNEGIWEMCGCYWQWVGLSTAGQGGTYTDVGGQGRQYLPIYAMLAGSYWSAAASAGPRARFGNASRASVNANFSSRGAARAVLH